MTLPSPPEWPVENPLPNRSADVLRERATATPDRTAIVDTESGERFTYGAFDRRVDAWSGGLAARVDLDGTRVGVALPTGLDFATAYFAIVRQNSAVVPLNLRETAATMSAQAERAAVDAVLCAESTESIARTAAPSAATVVSVDDPNSGVVRVLEPVEAGETVGMGEKVGTTAGPETERLVQFTSGTTGDPKGVRLTRGNLLASAVGSADRLGVDTEDRWLVCLPMYHMGGLAPLVRSTLYGTTTVFQSEFDEQHTATVLDEHGVTGGSLVPTMLRRLLDDGWTPSESLRFVLLGGAPARPTLIERCLERGIPVYPTYGTTETASQITTATPQEASDEPETVGRPLRGTTVTVVEDGTACSPNEVGELVVSGPTVTPGYLDDEQTDAAFDGRGFHTGDVGYHDENGRYFVVGRVDDQIVTGGENVQPASVARTLEAQSGVDGAAVVGVPDETWGQRVAAVIVPASDDITAEAVRERARREIADFAVPKTMVLVDALPRTASGTIDRDAVKSRIADDGSND